MARHFNGSNEFIDIGAAVVTAKPLTLVAWFYLDAAASLTGNYDVIAVGNAATGSRNECYMEAGGGTSDLSAYQFIAGTATRTAGATALSLTTWYHGACVYPTSGNTLVYLNGVVDGSSAIDNTSPTGMTDTKIGGFVDLSGATINFFFGNLADAAVYNVALTASEILSLGTGAARPNKIRPSALVGYWPITGLQSPEPDYSGLGRSGTLNGAVVPNAFGPPIVQFTPRWRQPDPFLPPVFTLMPQIVT